MIENRAGQTPLQRAKKKYAAEHYNIPVKLHRERDAAVIVKWQALVDKHGGHKEAFLDLLR